MSDGLIGSLINPSMLNRGSDVMRRGDVAVVPPRALEGQLVDSQRQAAELPVSMNRFGPRSEQAMSQYQAFSGAGPKSVGAGFSAIV